MPAIASPSTSPKTLATSAGAMTCWSRVLAATSRTERAAPRTTTSTTVPSSPGPRARAARLATTAAAAKTSVGPSRRDTTSTVTPRASTPPTPHAVVR